MALDELPVVRFLSFFPGIPIEPGVPLAESFRVIGVRTPKGSCPWFRESRFAAWRDSSGKTSDAV